MKTKILEFKTGISRGRNTYGYNIVSLWVDGVKVATCNGGGYDMYGAVLGEFIEKECQSMLLPLKDRAMKASIEGEENIPPTNHLDGLYFFGGGFSIDGGCGMEAVEKIIKAMGLVLKLSHRSTKNVKKYILFELGESVGAGRGA